MKSFGIGDRLPDYEVRAHNYGADHANRIHSDEVASQYGYEGALVPGVAVYAYMTRPVVEALGRDWLRSGEASAKFLKPVYDADVVRVEAKVADIDPLQVDLNLFNSKGELCAVGRAGLPDSPFHFDAAKYQWKPAADANKLRPATIAAIKEGDVLGSLDFKLDSDEEGKSFLDDMLDSSLIYRGAEAVPHPAFWIAQSNEIVMHNVALGPWIHTSSDVRHLDLARNGERLSLRGSVIEAIEKRGHEIITLDLALFGENDRPIALIRHSAIIKLRESE